MHVCGMDRCRDSDDYGRVIFFTGINVWTNPDPNRGGIHHQLAYFDEVTVINERRVSAGPGGLWYELAEGGWMDDYWLTDTPCDAGNLQEYSFTDCLEGEY